jgi:hypothetical protein
MPQTRTPTTSSPCFSEWSWPHVILLAVHATCCTYE